MAEDIRIDGAKSALNNYVDADVDRFNAMVGDYNSRCSSFKYQTNNRGRNDLNSSCRIPDDCIDKNRYPLFMARSVLRELIESLPSTRSL